ncbi:DUF1993 domain-containing protein [Aquabacterium sp. OR-4]|uniref:DUF1993 domain-containing protein n=1 Tax=Aquabacterium sp. OR-4 TaxID=2978127 RepID=UPI0021B39F84|nr:DUF1993 domain-containing protein [Aquabacterium sp. OR-4]MDT7834907.1 DUF1993 domain-containing protein [Aquabacterium sp. OR-4]
MSPITLYSASVPLFQKQLGAMLDWLEKAEAHARERQFEPDNYLQLRLAPDMLPLLAQVRIAGDMAKGCAARLAGLEPPRYEDDETRFEQLRGRIAKTLDFMASVPASAIDGQEGREIVLPMRNREALRFSADVYLRHWALPNFYFHATTTYALLRHAGVALGKSDYLAMA